MSTVTDIADEVVKRGTFKFFISCGLLIVGVMMISASAYSPPVYKEVDGQKVIVSKGGGSKIATEIGSVIAVVARAVSVTTRAVLRSVQSRPQIFLPAMLCMTMAAAIMKALPDGVYETWFLMGCIFLLLVALGGFYSTEEGSKSESLFDISGATR